jgi:opacity protein-like surface antigen
MVLVALAMTLFATTAAAQIPDPQQPVPQPVAQPMSTSMDRPLMVGVKAGGNYSTLALDNGDVIPVKAVWGGVGGLSIGRYLSANVGLQLEALFSQRGAQDDVEVADATLRLTYIDLPVTVRVGTANTNGARFHVFTGPQFGIKIKAEVINDMLDITTDLDEETKDWDFGWTAGVGVDLHPITLDARYTFGLTDINNTNTENNNDNWAKNRTFAVMIGVRLR